MERKANKILSRPWLTRLVFGCLPAIFTNNIIIGWLGYDSRKTGLCHIGVRILCDIMLF